VIWLNSIRATSRQTEVALHYFSRRLADNSEVFLPVYGELLFGQSRVRRHDAKPECSSMSFRAYGPRNAMKITPE